MKIIIASLMVFIALISSCGSAQNIVPKPITVELLQVDLDPIETFIPSEQPESFSFDSRTFISPWGYTKAGNENRLYPLLVSGYWGDGMSQYSSVNKQHPAFVIDYQKDGVSDGEVLAQWISNAITAGYRIDFNRIYLTGFSQGGSGSFPLARGMANKGKYFAAIIRVAGQSQSDLGNDIANKTAVWYHIGLKDDTTRVDVARAAFANFSAYPCNTGALKIEKSDTITGYQRTTVTLVRAGFEMFKYSEYTGMDHTSSPCYLDEALFPWMFSQSLVLR